MYRIVQRIRDFFGNALYKCSFYLFTYLLTFESTLNFSIVSYRISELSAFVTVFPSSIPCILQAGSRIGSRAAKLLATHSSPSNCNKTDYWQFSLGVKLRQMLLLPEF